VSLHRKHAAHENHERWLVSYADFITLLFAFFVVMFASSQTDKARARQVSEAVTKALENGRTVGLPPSVAKILGGTVDEKGIGNAMMRGPGGARRSTKEAQPDSVLELIPSLRRLNRELEKDVRDGKLEVKLEPRGLVVSLHQSAFFPSGTDVIDPATYSTINKVAEVIRGLPNPIQIEGHTDSVPIHNARFRSNWDLSSARAISMLQLLCGQFQLPESRFSVVGRADTVPVDSNQTEEGRQRNRRIDIIISNILGLEPDEKSPAKPSPYPSH
jgi:chemotaxis protein MotB